MKKNEIWKILEEERKNSDQWFVENGVKEGEYPRTFAETGANDKEISNAEINLNIKFSPSYRYYLKKCGGGSPTQFEICGLKKVYEDDQEDECIVTDVTNHYRLKQNWPGTHEWYVVCSDHDGNPYGVDKDGKVWLSDHDTQEIILVADDFEEFLYLLYTDTMWDEEYKKVIPWDKYLEDHKNK